MLLFSLGPALQVVGIAALVLTAAVYALVWADGVPSRDVRTLFRRCPKLVPPEPVEAEPNRWVALVAPDLSEQELAAFREFATRVRPDFDQLGREHVEAMYETWLMWGDRPR